MIYTRNNLHSILAVVHLALELALQEFGDLLGPQMAVLAAISSQLPVAGPAAGPVAELAAELVAVEVVHRKQQGSVQDPLQDCGVVCWDRNLAAAEAGLEDLGVGVGEIGWLHCAEGHQRHLLGQ